MPFGRLLSGYERWPLPPLRRRALAVCERKIVEGQRVDGTWDGMYAPSISSLLALRVMGYPQDHPVIQKGVEGLKGFAGWEAGFRRTLSRPLRVWDTAAAVATLGDAGLAPDHPALVRSVDWLLEQELRGTGGWSHTSAASHPTIETTAEVTIALRSVEHPDPMRVERAVARAVAWTLNVQGRDGFWLPSEAEPGDRPHTDRAGGSRTLLSRLNLRAHEEPVSVDATARVIEMLTGEGLADDEAVSRAREWLIETQQPNGSWEGALRRTAAAIPALAAAGEKPASIPVQRSRRWLLSRQNSDGGWGREPTVSDRSEGSDAPRDSTTQHTAWALLALLASGECGAAVRRGAAWLAAAQRSNGDWEPTPEAEPTGDFRNGERRMGPNLPTLALGRTVRSGGQNRLETES